MELSVARGTESGFCSGVVLATVLVGFAPCFLLRPLFAGWPAPPESMFHVHGAWLAAARRMLGLLD